MMPTRRHLKKIPSMMTTLYCGINDVRQGMFVRIVRVVHSKPNVMGSINYDQIFQIKFTFAAK